MIVLIALSPANIVFAVIWGRGKKVLITPKAKVDDLEEGPKKKAIQAKEPEPEFDPIESTVSNSALVSKTENQKPEKKKVS